MSDSTDRPSTRREEYAEATRQAIVDAARQLFCQNGYFATKVEHIAKLARVSPATVYAVAGGKQGLLRTLMEIGTTASAVATTMEAISRSADPDEIIDLLAKGVRIVREEFGDTLRLIVETAPHEDSAGETWAAATQRYRAALATPAHRLADLNALREGITRQDAIDILWFYFGYAGLSTLVLENGWSFDKAEIWLAGEARRALLKKGRGGA
ncbi:MULTISPECIES: TetR/AcrR family transcriptional regulator [Rhodomicrobium]|uniref:TetR/AcrR family transcriptional regulator n=1 Tax=Rhodomicrobium TaxID=1068 RepID=UPI000B4AF652|nr:MULTISPECIES: TetR/AcrR family transcriptional regulator [Rhodomicrobium]